MNNNCKALKSGIWYTASNFLVKSIGFIMTPIFTRLLTHSEFGEYNNYVSWLGIIQIIVTLNLESTLISARYEYEDKFDSFILSMLALSSFNTIVWLVVVNSWSSSFVTLFNLDLKYINAMLLYLLFLPSVNMFQTRERYYFDYKKTVLTSVALAVGTALLSFLLVVKLPDKLDGRILGATIPTVLLGVIFYIFFFIRGKKVNFIYWRYAIPICLPFIPHLLSLTLLNSTDRVMITRICGPEQTALYSLAYTCGSMVTLLISSLNGAFAPWLGEKLSKKEYSQIRRVSYLYILAFVVMSVGIMLLSPEMLYILGGETYMEAVYVLAPVSMGYICQFIYTMFVNIEQFSKKTGGMAIGSMIAAVINFVLNLILIPKLGYLVAAYTTLIGYIVLLAIHMYIVYRLGLKEIYDYKFVGIVVMSGIVLMILITMLYSNPLLRYFVICLFWCYAIFLLCKYRDKLFNLLNR